MSILDSFTAMLVAFFFCVVNEDFAEGILQRVWLFADRWIVGIELSKSIGFLGISLQII